MASKSSIEAGRGHVTLATENGPLDRGLAAASSRFKEWGKGVIALGAGISAAGASVTAPFLYGLTVLSEWGSGVVTASRQTGISFEGVQGVAASLRTDLEGLTHSVGHLDAFLGELAHGSQEAGRTLLELGLDAQEMLGPMSQEERIRRFSEAIAGIGDAAQRVAAARKIFGRGAIDMDFSGGVEGLRAREARQGATGGILSSADVALVQQYNLAQKDMNNAIRSLWASIGAAAAPLMTEFFQLIAAIVLVARDWTNRNRELLDTIFRIADKVVPAGLAIAALGGILFGVGLLLPVVGTGIGLVGTMLYFLSGASLVNTASMLVWKGIVWLSAFAMGAYAVAIKYAASWFSIMTVLGWAKVAAMTVLLPVILLAKAAWWLYTAAVTGASIATTAATAGINLLIAAVVALGVVIAALPLIWFGAALVSGLAAASRGLLRIREAIESLPSSAASSMRELLGAVTSTWSAIVGHVQSRLNELVGDATSAWNAIRDSMSAADMDLLWRAVVASARLAWLHIQDMAMAIWPDLRYGAIAAWNDIKDVMVDAIAAGIVKLKQSMIVAWAFAKEGWNAVWTGALGGEMSTAAINTRARARVQAQIDAAAVADREYGTRNAELLFEQRNQLIEQAIRDIRAEVAPAAPQGGNNLAIGGNIVAPPDTNVPGAGNPFRMSPQQLRDLERNRRDLDLWIAQEQDRIQGGADNAAEIERARAALAAVELEAWIAAEQRRIQGGVDLAQGGGAAGFAAAGRGMVHGGFSAGALFGALGTPRGETAAERALRLQDRANQILADAVRLLDQIRQVAGARVA